jgi:cystathionine beta-lyase/cystathionine gamma-synthase
MKFATKAVHAGVKADPATGAINTPLYQTSTYIQEAPGKNKGYAYARGQNPTREALEASIAALENGKFGICFASGIAAVDAIIRLMKPGDEIITTKDLYGGTYRLFANIFEPMGIHFNYISLEDMKALKTAISKKTKMIWLETPTNPMTNIIDIGLVAEIAKESGLLLAVDNTFATPCLQRPIELGADIVMHSATKYLGGHSDLIMGAVVVNDEDLEKRLRFIQNTCGAIPGPNECFLTRRGLKTLHLRMERNCSNAMKIAEFLESHPNVGKVYYPGLPSHPGHQIAKKQMKDFGAMIAFELADDREEKAFELMKKLSIFSLAESLGGVESLCGHPATMSHGSVKKEDRLALGIKDSLIRLSIGVEDVDDLLDDLRKALS